MKTVRVTLSPTIYINDNYMISGELRLFYFLNIINNKICKIYSRQEEKI
jgi:hypothetical protein